MKTAKFNESLINEQAMKKLLPSDAVVEFTLRQEKKDAGIQSTDKLLNHILFILDGEVNVSYGEFRNHLCRTGEMIFIPCDSVASFDAFSDISYIMLDFNNQFTINSEIGWGDMSEFEGERDVFHKLDIRSPLTDVLESITYYQQHGIRHAHLNLVKQKELFLVMKVFYSRQEIYRFLRPMLKQDSDFKAFVMAHYKNVKNVEELATICNMSSRAFMRKFKTQFNDSPYRWILRQKAAYIKLLLADRKIPLTLIIKEYGFSSPAHFTTYCKKQFGETPSAFRNAINGKADSPASNRRHVNASSAKSGADGENQSHTV
jgi:AraC-like DNA-binding protein